MPSAIRSSAERQLPVTMWASRCLNSSTHRSVPQRMHRRIPQHEQRVRVRMPDVVPDKVWASFVDSETRVKFWPVPFSALYLDLAQTLQRALEIRYPCISRDPLIKHAPWTSSIHTFFAAPQFIGHRPPNTRFTHQEYQDAQSRPAFQRPGGGSSGGHQGGVALRSHSIYQCVPDAFQLMMAGSSPTALLPWAALLTATTRATIVAAPGGASRTVSTISRAWALTRSGSRPRAPAWKARPNGARTITYVSSKHS